MSAAVDSPANTDPTRHPTTGETVEEYLTSLDEQLAALDAADEADPAMTAVDPAAWQARDAKRSRDRSRLTSERRFVVDFRHVAWTHDRQLTEYMRTARPVQARWAKVTETHWFADEREGGSSNAARMMRDWEAALQRLFTGLDQRDTLHMSLLAREFGRFHRVNNALRAATSAWAGHVFPNPEVEGGLPSWLFVGAVRTDLQLPDPWAAL